MSVQFAVIVHVTAGFGGLVVGLARELAPRPEKVAVRAILHHPSQVRLLGTHDCCFDCFCVCRFMPGFLFAELLNLLVR